MPNTPEHMKTFCEGCDAEEGTNGLTNDDFTQMYDSRVLCPDCLFKAMRADFDKLSGSSKEDFADACGDNIEVLKHIDLVELIKTLPAEEVARLMEVARATISRG